MIIVRLIVILEITTIILTIPSKLEIYLFSDKPMPESREERDAFRLRLCQFLPPTGSTINSQNAMNFWNSRGNHKTWALMW